MFDPLKVLKTDGTPYKVFTPFYRNGCLKQAPPPRFPLPAPTFIPLADIKDEGIESLNLHPQISWYKSLECCWGVGADGTAEIGELGASKRLNRFLTNGMNDYKEGRNFPFKNKVSRLSPHFHFGKPNHCLSPYIGLNGHRREEERKYVAELQARRYSADASRRW